ncbi:DUF3231 family protein [Neobacillus sp. LXY-4]|uniref:DUF3231 family protein n=1 Tax=Neobacillus sp. LXY-4 TaxID=3379826 RepID=UPI003EE1557A
MESQHSIRLTAAKLTALWTNYLADTMSICVFKYFHEKVDDTEIKPIQIHAMNMSKEHIGIIEKIR